MNFAFNEASDEKNVMAEICWVLQHLIYFKDQVKFFSKDQGTIIHFAK